MFKLNKLTILMVISLTILAFSACDAKKPGATKDGTLGNSVDTKAMTGSII